MLRIHRYILPALVAVCAAAFAANAQVPTRKVAVTGDPAPGGGTFRFRTPPDNEGEVPAIAGDTIAFLAAVVDDRGTTTHGVFVETHGTLRLAAHTGDPVLGGHLGYVGKLSVDSLGNAFFCAKLPRISRKRLPRKDARSPW